MREFGDYKMNVLKESVNRDDSIAKILWYREHNAALNKAKT